MKRLWTLWTENPLLPALATMVVIVVLAAMGFAYFEAQTQAEAVGFFEGLWWAVVTLFTVGYGDFVPKTWPGRLVGIGVMVTGIALVSAVTGVIASFLVERRFAKRRGTLSIMTNGHLLILGWNAHGLTLLESLRRHAALAQANVTLVADMEPTLFEELTEASGLGTRLQFVRGKPSVKSVLERANPAGAILAYLLADENLSPDEADNASVLAALTLRSLTPRLPLYAEVLKTQSREHLLRAGATKCLGRDELAGKALGFMAGHPVMHEFLQAMLEGSQQGALGFRTMSPEEKSLTWKALVNQAVARDGRLPVAVCRLPRELTLSDVLDTTKALDNYILELFKSAGRGTSLGSQGSRVVLNPGADVNLAEFDGLIFLPSGT